MEAFEQPTVERARLDPELDFADFPASGGNDDAVLVIDASGVIRYASDRAGALLRIPGPLAGRPVAALRAAGRLGDLIRGAEPPATVRVHGRYVEVRRIAVGAARVGAVVVLRDHTELVDLYAELADVHAVVVGLRTRQHEHANRLHVALGLLETGQRDAAVSYLREMIGMPAQPDPSGTAVGGAATNLAALLSTKASIAAARGVRLTIEWRADLDQLGIDPATLESIVGNLIDNAIEAAAGRPHAGVDVTARTDRAGVQLVVRDTGPGIHATADVFVDGYSTKQQRDGMPRGFGLALVRHLVARSAGAIAVHNDGGAVFTVRWPARPAGAA